MSDFNSVNCSELTVVTSFRNCLKFLTTNQRHIWQFRDFKRALTLFSLVFVTERRHITEFESAKCQGLFCKCLHLAILVFDIKNTSITNSFERIKDIYRNCKYVEVLLVYLKLESRTRRSSDSIVQSRLHRHFPGTNFFIFWATPTSCLSQESTMINYRVSITYM